MAPRQKDLLTRLSDAGEEALSRVAGSQATTRVVETVGGMRERLDEMQKKVRGLDALEQRVADLEKRVDELSKPKRTTAARSRAATTRKAPGTTPRTTRKRPPPPG
jgi:phage shock protein A